ncbi:hypothetical protein ElyMa_003178100 [Elysia marginata]|uniref:Uncharacterized protein n=1 Tax=Elysia marginata TaxID=1093978 RepID=A0AAV4IZC7_9GAST|nr:hypothetical protein ElyMa_003178100 [Elysia marginata]
MVMTMMMMMMITMIVMIMVNILMKGMLMCMLLQDDDDDDGDDDNDDCDDSGEYIDKDDDDDQNYKGTNTRGPTDPYTPQGYPSIPPRGVNERISSITGIARAMLRIRRLCAGQGLPPGSSCLGESTSRSSVPVGKTRGTPRCPRDRMRDGPQSPRPVCFNNGAAGDIVGSQDTASWSITLPGTNEKQYLQYGHGMHRRSLLPTSKTAGTPGICLVPLCVVGDECSGHVLPSFHLAIHTNSESTSRVVYNDAQVVYNGALPARDKLGKTRPTSKTSQV